jgi:hypothetical protein
VVYAPPGPSYTISSTPTLTPPITWSPYWHGSIDNTLFQVISVSRTNSSSFFRASAP